MVRSRFMVLFRITLTVDVIEFGFTESSVRLVCVRQIGVGRIVLMQRQTARRISPTSRLLVPTDCRDRQRAEPDRTLRVDRLCSSRCESV